MCVCVCVASASLQWHTDMAASAAQQDLPHGWGRVSTGGARRHIVRAIAALVGAKRQAIPIALEGDPDWHRLNLRAAGNGVFGETTHQEASPKPDGGWYEGHGHLDPLLCELRRVFRGVPELQECDVVELSGLIREGYGANHDYLSSAAGGNQIAHCDVTTQVDDAVGGTSVVFITGDQESHMWSGSADNCSSFELVPLPAHTATTVPGSTGVHAGATFKWDNCLLHAYLPHNRAKFEAAVLAANKPVWACLDLVEKCSEAEAALAAGDAGGVPPLGVGSPEKTQSSVTDDRPSKPVAALSGAATAARPLTAGDARRDRKTGPCRGGAFVAQAAMSRHFVEQKGCDGKRLQYPCPSPFCRPGPWQGMVSLLLPEQCATDNYFCGGDAVNAGCGKVVLTRENTGTASDQPLCLHSSAVRSAMSKSRRCLVIVFSVKRKARKNDVASPPSLSSLLKEPAGVFLLEFNWNTRAKGRTAMDWHVVTINCDARWVFCNELGYMSFSLGNVNETAKTHADLAALFSVRRVSSVYQLLQFQTRALPCGTLRCAAWVQGGAHLCYHCYALGRRGV